MKMKKLLVCDVEGTIFKAPFKIDGTDYASTMWQPIAKKLGEAALEEERLTHEKWDNGEYASYLDWVKATIDIHKKYSLKQSVFDELIISAEYNPGVEEFFSTLDRDIWVPVLISGGFKNLIRRAQNELDIDYGFGACEYYFDKYGYLEHYSLQPSDFAGKISSLKGLIKELGLNYATDWVFVGDGKNDEAIAKKAPMAFGINPHDKLKNIDGLIEIASFMDILPYLNSFAKSDQAEKTASPTKTSKQPKPKDPASILNRRVIDLVAENRKLKQKLNDQKGRMESRERGESLPIKQSDYEHPIEQSDYNKTTRVTLPDLLNGLRVVFLGLRKEYASFKRLENFTDLRVIPVGDDHFDTQIFKNADIVFVYKNCISHAAVKRALESSNTPYCLLEEHTNEQLLDNALANVLYRFLYEM